MRRVTLLAALLFIAACTAQTTGHELSSTESTEPVVFTPITVDHYDSEVIFTEKDIFTVPVNIKKESKPKIQVKQPTVKVEFKKVTIPKNEVKRYAFKRLGSDQFRCIDKLWERESNWNYRAYNQSSGAYGIPQALPGSKMSSAGSDWKTNPFTQVRWGIGYVNGRYGSACGAWSFWVNNRWY